MAEKVQAALAKLIDIIAGASLYDVRLSSQAADLHMLRAELADTNSFSEADFSAAIVLLGISDKKPEREKFLQEAKAERTACSKARDDAIASLQKLEDRLVEVQQQLAQARLDNEEAIARARAEHDRAVQAHQKRMAAEAAESTRALNAAQSDASAAANLRATLDARLENIRKVAAS